MHIEDLGPYDRCIENPMILQEFNFLLMEGGAQEKSFLAHKRGLGGRSKPP